MTIAGEPAAPLEIEIGERSRLLIVAGEWPLRADPGRAARQRRSACPATSTRSRCARTSSATSSCAAAPPADSANAGACFINGLLLEGQLVVAPGNLGQLGARALHA